MGPWRLSAKHQEPPGRVLGRAAGLCTCCSFCLADPFVALLQNRLGAPAIPGSGATWLRPQVWGLCEAVFLVLRAGPGTGDTWDMQAA